MHFKIEQGPCQCNITEFQGFFSKRILEHALFPVHRAQKSGHGFGLQDDLRRGGNSLTRTYFGKSVVDRGLV